LALAAVIEIVSGPGAGKVLTLAPGAGGVLGRGSDAQLVIPDPAISRRHIELRNDQAGVLVRDLGSRHGALLDGRAIPKEGALVTLRAVLAIGTTRVAISRSSAPARPSLPGLRFEEKLGAGASGVVWAAWQEPPGRRVAVKVLAPRAKKIVLARVRREALLGGRLEHPAIPRIHDAVFHGGRLHLIRELVVGHSLEDALAGGALPWRQAVTLGATVAGALAHAHERGVVHRDVKPANIMIDRETGGARLVDFDLAKDDTRRPTVEEATRLTVSGEGLGTLCYLAPEQLEDAHHVGPKADVYGLGAVLYEMLSGARPFAGVAPDEYVRALMGAGPAPLDALAPGVPAKLRACVSGALAVEPDERPTAAELARALAALA
jgi:serine/threonine-protein kinase